MNDPRKIWKLSDMDLKSYRRWYDYSRARDAMFAATDTAWAPWYIAHTDNKRRGRLNIITHLLSQIPYKPLSHRDVTLPKRQRPAATTSQTCPCSTSRNRSRHSSEGGGQYGAQVRPRARAGRWAAGWRSGCRPWDTGPCHPRSALAGPARVRGRARRGGGAAAVWCAEECDRAADGSRRAGRHLRGGVVVPHSPRRRALAGGGGPGRRAGSRDRGVHRGRAVVGDRAGRGARGRGRGRRASRPGRRPAAGETGRDRGAAAAAAVS